MPKNKAGRRVKLGSSLQGDVVAQASSVAVGLCRDQTLVGIDLLDINGQPLIHAHFDIHGAIAFHQAFGSAMVELAHLEGHVATPETQGTKH